MTLATIKKRSEFLSVRGGNRWSTPAFLLEAKQRAGQVSADQDMAERGVPRFGFTVTKKLGNAVVR
ncbi:MAG: Ribonuclease protein component, partial [Pseudomonadota bacterium]